MTDVPMTDRKGAILAPMGVSGEDADALICAARIAERLKRPLLLLHVIHEPAEHPGLYRQLHGGDPMLPIDELAQTLCHQRLSALQSANPNLDSLSRATLLFVSGVPGRRIVEVADDLEVALIVMGAHHHSAFDRLLHGSITSHVLRHSARPVLEVDAEGTANHTDDSLPAARYLAKAQALISPRAAAV